MKTETTLHSISLKEQLLQAFEDELLPRVNDEKDFMRTIRLEAMDHFRSLGFPTQKLEEWK